MLYRKNRGLDFFSNPRKDIFNIKGSGVKDLVKSIPTTVKTRINERHGFHRAYDGEVHPMSITTSKKTGRQVLAFNNYLGPNTNVRTRLIKKVKPLPPTRGMTKSADEIGYLHDLEFGTARKVGDLRPADRRFIRNLKKLRKEGAPRFNTDIGIKGIQLKNRLEDTGIIRKDKFFNPLKEDDPVRQIAEREKKRLEQKGYGPGELLRKKIERQLRKKIIKRTDGKVVKLKQIGDMVSNRMIPIIINMMRKRTGIIPRKVGQGYRNEISDGIKRILQLQMKQRGTGVGTAITIASAVLPIAIPIIKKLGEFLLPKIMKLFTKKKRGTGVLKDLIGGLSASVIGKFIKMMFEAATKARQQRGSGFDKTIKRMVKKFVDVASKVLTVGQTGIREAKKIMPKLEKKDILSVLVQDVLPLVTKGITQISGVKPLKVGKGKKLDRILRSRILKKTNGRPLRSTDLTSTVYPLITRMFRVPKGKGKQEKLIFDKMVQDLIKMQSGGGAFMDKIKRISRGFIAAMGKLIKTLGPIVGPALKEAGPILIKHGLPILLKSLEKKK
jgi:hypothetical protein